MQQTDPKAALSIIRNKLQIILSQSQLCKNPSHCETCGVAVQQIVGQIYALEAYVKDLLKD